MSKGEQEGGPGVGVSVWLNSAGIWRLEVARWVDVVINDMHVVFVDLACLAGDRWKNTICVTSFTPWIK